MPRYEEIQTRFWDEPDMQGWSPHAKLLYVYLLTGPLSHGITGIYPMTRAQIQHRTNLKPRQIATSFAAIGPRVRQYAGSWLWIVARFKHGCKSPNHYKAALKYLMEEVPAEIVADFCSVYVGSAVDTHYGARLSTLQGTTKGLRTVPGPYPDPSPSP